MKLKTLFFVLTTISTTSMARDSIQDFSVEEAMALPKISSAIGDGIKFYFTGQKHAAIEQSLGEYQSNKKTNAFGKSDKEACQWAFASAMKSLKQRAEKEGGNAVINIHSNYKGTKTTSDKTFKCGAGNVIAGVALVGEVVKLKN